MRIFSFMLKKVVLRVPTFNVLRKNSEKRQKHFTKTCYFTTIKIPSTSHEVIVIK